MTSATTAVARAALSAPRTLPSAASVTTGSGAADVLVDGFTSGSSASPVQAEKPISTAIASPVAPARLPRRRAAELI